MSTISRILMVGAAIALSSSLAQAQMGGPPQEDYSYLEDIEVETFIWRAPDKWAPYSKETEAKKTAMYLPFSQKPENFKESLIFTEFKSKMGASSAAQVKDILVNASSGSCGTQKVTELEAAPAGGRGGPGGGRGGSDDEERGERPERPERAEGEGARRPEGPPPGGRGGADNVPGMENGYSSVSWEEECSAGAVKYSLNKVILGNEGLYTVKKTWKGSPSNSQKQRWVRTLQSVFVCDPRTGVNDCNPPAGAGGPGGGGR